VHRRQDCIARELAADAHQIGAQLFESAGAGQRLEDGCQTSLAQSIPIKVELLQRTAVRDEKSQLHAGGASSVVRAVRGVVVQRKTLIAWDVPSAQPKAHLQRQGLATAHTYSASATAVSRTACSSFQVCTQSSNMCSRAHGASHRSRGSASTAVHNTRQRSVQRGAERQRRVTWSALNGYDGRPQ